MRHPIPIGRRRTWLAAVALLALVAGAASAQQAAPPATQPPEPPRILPAEVKALADKGKVLIVDVRDKASYDFEHAEGAISIPLGDLEKRLAELPKDKQIAAYCT
jgi:predicted sulfurtransferase